VRVDLERERLLVELLTLNFHEHFESKPLLLHVEKRIRSELSGQDRERALSSLVSIVRRVSDRQIATLMWEARNAQKAQIEKLCVTLLKPSPNPDLVSQGVLHTPRAPINYAEFSKNLGLKKEWRPEVSAGRGAAAR
jgi:hypothetical protein